MLKPTNLFTKTLFPVFCILLNSSFICATVSKYVILNDNAKMPNIGLGTWQANSDLLEKALDIALDAGYRHFDTATVYGNEKSIGKVLNKWLTTGKVNRSDLFIVTKLPNIGMRPEHVEYFLNKSLTDLQIDYVDLYLIHGPFGMKYLEGELHSYKPDGSIDIDPTTDHIAIWKKMEEQVDKGRARSIGLSNFNISQITRILNNSRIKPSNLQIEIHAYHQQNELVDFCKSHNISVTAYSPFGNPSIGKYFQSLGVDVVLPDILGNPVILEIAQKHNKTAAQVVLRQHLQRGLIIIPKSTNEKRIRENINVYDFELDEQDLSKLAKLDKKIRIINFKHRKGLENHPEYPFADELL